MMILSFIGLRSAFFALMLNRNPTYLEVLTRWCTRRKSLLPYSVAFLRCPVCRTCILTFLSSGVHASLQHKVCRRSMFPHAVYLLLVSSWSFQYLISRPNPNCSVGDADLVDPGDVQVGMVF